MPRSLVLQALSVALAIGSLAYSSANATTTPAFTTLNSMEARVQGCVTCHGRDGEGTSNGRFPRIAGKPAGYLYNQLVAFRNGTRHYPPMNYLVAYLPDAYLREMAEHYARLRPPFEKKDDSPVDAAMQGLARNLSDRDIGDIATYYDSLPKARTAPARYSEMNAPALVRVGDPLRNIAPCIACHGGTDHKLGAPWLEGMPKEYLVVQLRDFQTGTRRNDSHAQMRNMTREMTAAETEQVADFYARRPKEGDGK